MIPTQVGPKYEINARRGDSNRKICTTLGSRPDSPGGLKAGSGRVGDTKNENAKMGYETHASRARILN